MHFRKNDVIIKVKKNNCENVDLYLQDKYKPKYENSQQEMIKYMKLK